MTSFRKDLSGSELVESPPMDLEQLTVLYTRTSSPPPTLEKYASETVKQFSDRPASAWYNSTIRNAQRARRRARVALKCTGSFTVTLSLRTVS